MDRTFQVELLFAPGCKSREATIAMVEKLTTGRADINVVTHLIETGDEVLEHRFLGSPSIRVNGVDIEPGAETRTDFAIG